MEETAPALAPVRRCRRAAGPARVCVAAGAARSAQSYLLSLFDADDDLRDRRASGSIFCSATAALISFGHAAFIGHRRLCRRHPRRERRARDARSSLAGRDRRVDAVRLSDRARRAAHRGVYFIMITLAFAQMAYLPRDARSRPMAATTA